VEKNTILAIVLSVVVVAGSFIIQGVFFPKTAPPPLPPKTTQVTPTAPTETPQLVPHGDVPALQAIAATPQTVVVETNLMRVTLSNKGAVATSIELKKHLDNGKPVEMVATQWGTGDAFETDFGGFGKPPIDTLFQVEQLGPHQYRFSQNFLDEKGVPFTLEKTFTFHNNDYMIEVDVTTKSLNGTIPDLSKGRFAYTLTYGPQIGPSFTKLDGSVEYRKFYRLEGNNRKDETFNNETKSFDEDVKWAAIVGKYFTVIGVPDGTTYETTFSDKNGEGDKQVARLAFSRPALQSSTTKDIFHFYVGPKEDSVLKTYDQADTNAFKMTDLKLERVQEDNFLLGWLEVILKWVLQGIVFLIPNWGVAIIILTILIKLVLWPLTQKSYRASAAMQALQPKLKEVQAKYKDDPKKLNEQTMALYQKEGVNPMGGCLPMLLQIPVFFALYGMFQNQFDLRGAMFIPGWIPDLSVPDVIFSWGFPLPFLNWTSLHLLPFIMVGSQIWSSSLSQPAGGQTSQMKIMTYGIPIIFFFMLYAMPSGLMVYWCVQNILTVFQQSYVNKHFKKPNAALKIVPSKKGRR
jgi:YidC/Oxa1 family membrane protein insertase